MNSHRQKIRSHEEVIKRRMTQAEQTMWDNLTTVISCGEHVMLKWPNADLANLAIAIDKSRETLKTLEQVVTERKPKPRK